MTISSQVAVLLEVYLDREYSTSIDKEEFKKCVSKLNLFPLDLIKVTNLVESQGYVVIIEPLLVYDKEQQYARLTVAPKESEQVINKLSFDTRCYNAILAGCERKGFFTSGLIMTIEHGTYTAYSNCLIIAKDLATLKYVKNEYNSFIN